VSDTGKEQKINKSLFSKFIHNLFENTKKTQGAAGHGVGDEQVVENMGAGVVEFAAVMD
jgi:hypothetical protein